MGFDARLGLNSERIKRAGVEAMKVALEYAAHSPDPSTQNAAVLISRDGEILEDTLVLNTFPEGVDVSEERWERPVKYHHVEHAERNAIYAAARAGIQTHGKIMVCVWAACSDCARAIIQAGIACLVRYKDGGDAVTWNDSISIADSMMLEAGVEIITIEEPLDGFPVLRRNGQAWSTSRCPLMELA